MRDRRKTIESLKRLAERPGTPHEGETARRLLEKMVTATQDPRERAFKHADFPMLAEVWYAYWCYRNEHGYIVSEKIGRTLADGKVWMRIKFDHLKRPRWVPVTSSECGCHISRTRWSDADAGWLYEMGRRIEPDWDALLRECARQAGL